MTESVIINRLVKGENKVTFILILPPPLPPPLHPPDRSLTLTYKDHFWSLWKEIFSHIGFHCAPFFERSSFSPYYLQLYSSNYYIDKYRCYCASRRLKEMLDSPACRYNTCNIVVNITPTDSGSHDINWPEDSYFSSFIPRTCITGSVPPVKLVTYHVNVTNYNDQLHFFDG